VHDYKNLYIYSPFQDLSSNLAFPAQTSGLEPPTISPMRDGLGATGMRSHSRVGVPVSETGFIELWNVF
jgi:hypothetical protein